MTTIVSLFATEGGSHGQGGEQGEQGFDDGPLAPFADAYRAELSDRGYTPLTTVNQLRQVARLSRWLEAGGLGAAELSCGRVDEFLAFQRARGRDKAQWSRPGLQCLLDVLGRTGMGVTDESAGESSLVEVLLARFECHLLAERGLAAGTLKGYVRHARRFLGGLLPHHGLTAVGAGEVTAAVLAVSAAVSVSTAQFFVAGLRSFLRFCLMEGLVAADLSQAALPVTGGAAWSCPGGSPRRTLPPCSTAVIVGSRSDGGTMR